MQYLEMSNDELWLKKAFTEDMERRFVVRNFMRNTSMDVYEHAALHLAWHKSGLIDVCFSFYFFVFDIMRFLF
jgi:hypothetical protein